MKKRIFRAIVLVTTLIVVCCSVFMIWVVHKILLVSFMDRLDTESHYLRQGIEKEGIAYFKHIHIGTSRVTLIDSDGTVLYDSLEESYLPNHEDREEIREAFTYGTGSSTRYSSTLGERIIYRALRLDDGKILRLSGTENSLRHLMWRFFPAVFFACMASMMLAAWLARRIASRVVRPVYEIDLDHPEYTESYEELAPLLYRLSTQKRQLEKQMYKLQRRQHEFETITSNMTEGLLLLNAKGKVIFCNTMATRLLGLDSLLVGTTLLSLKRDESLRHAMQNAQINGSGHTLLHEGSRWVQIYVNSVHDQSEKIGSCILLCVDVTEKEDREVLRREFSANVSHELKTPLTSISGIAEMMQNGMIKVEDIPHFASSLYHETQRLLRMVNEIMRISCLDESIASGIDASKMEQVDLLDISQACLARLEKRALKQQINLHISGESTFVLGNRSMLEEMIINLCENAIKYNKQGGSVSIKIAKQNNVLEIVDTGIGIPVSLQQRVFERFFRVDKSRTQSEGTGLGLSIVQHIAKLHKAEIHLESKEGKGTKVEVCFPTKKGRQSVLSPLY